MRHFATLLAAVSLGLVGAGSAQAETWDFAGDFRPNSTGNVTPDRYGHAGVWSYYRVPTNDANTGTLLPDFTTQPFGAPFPYLADTYSWGSNSLQIYAGVKLGANFSCVSPQSCTFRNGDGYMHPSNAEDAAARWTSPIAGTVRVTGVMQSVDGNGTGTTYRVDKNSVSQTSGAITPTGGPYTFDFTTTVAVNDTITFRIGSGGNAVSDGTKVDFTVARPIPACDTPTITGNGTINGTAGDDVIVGGAGADTIHGNGGNDKICGRGGDDVVYGDAGNDVIDLGPGNDVANGNGGDTTGNDRTWGGGGADFIGTDAGIDRVLYDDAAGPVSVLLGSRTNTNGAVGTFDGTGDTVDSTIESVTGSPGADTLTAQGGNHTLYGETGSDLIIGSSGADFLAGGRGGDSLSGGAGSDRVTFRQAGTGYDTGSGVTVTLDGTADDGVSTAAGLDGVASSNRDNVGTDVEYLYGGTGNDTLNMIGYGGGFPGAPPAPFGVVASGYDGDDTLTGTINNDYLEGGNGTNDKAFCTSGDILVTIEVRSGC